MNQRFTFCPYSWYIDEDEKDVTSFRVYGIDRKDRNVCVRCTDFTPFVYLELPSNLPWDESSAQILGNKLDSLLKNQKPLAKCLCWKKRLYYAHLDKNKKRKLFPYLFLKFSHPSDIRNMSYKIRRPLNVLGVGLVKVKIHEQDASPILQWMSHRNISPAGWIKGIGRLLGDSEKITVCDKEFRVSWKNLAPAKSINMISSPLIMGFDIEVNSSNPSAMPKAEKPPDKVFQISCVLYRHGDEKSMKKYILTLGDPSERITGKDVNILKYSCEPDLLVGYSQFIRDHNPNVIVGYNILNFDIPYMIDRAKLLFCMDQFDQQGFNNAHASEKTIKWSSSAYGNQTFQFLDAEGRLYVDLLPLVKRDYKMDNYKLKTISTFFLGATKDPLTPKGIFKCYREGIKTDEKGNYSITARKAMGIVAKYCVQDSVLVIDLFNKLQTWVGLCEMANVCNVPIFYLYTQGQQIKVYSQLYKYCMYKNYVVERDGYIPKPDEHYVGATVFQPIAGVYDRVLPFDFKSLYPTTIIAYNIDYSTLVIDESISDEDCHVMEWEDHVGCEHDKTDRKTKPKHIMCQKRKFRFLKKPMGVMPTVLSGLLNARSRTRKQMKILKKEDEGKELTKEEIDLIKGFSQSQKNNLKILIDVLNKRQLAYKVSANSMYGAMGVTRGYLPFMPGAMATTAMGRKNITIVSKVIPERYGGKLIYGDTDTLLPDTPVLVKKDGQIEYRTMEELSRGDWKNTVTGKEISSPEDGLLVWSDIGFTPIKYVIRHAITKPLIRVTTHVGSVDCTLDHSLLWENGEVARASDVKVGSKLCISELPLPEDTPNEPIYPNKLTHQKIEEYKIPDMFYYDSGFSPALAFVWGLFYADGSCGTYLQSDQRKKSTWAINNQDNKLLQRCADILNRHNINGIKFKILNTMKSSGVNKLVPISQRRKKVLRTFVKKYRKLFYDVRRSKRVPSEIFNYPIEFRQSFFMGYYSGDGSKKDPSITCSNKGAIGSAGLFYLMRSIGYQVSINVRKDKPTIYKLIGSSPMCKFRYKPNIVKKIDPSGIYNSREPLIKGDYSEKPEYIYDIETENHHFAAGVGQLIVHNSNYIVFPHLKTAEENWDYAIKVAREVTKLFPPPIELEFEYEIYWRFLILTKKRYMYRKCGRDGILDDKIGKKGVLLARRDNSQFIRDIYAETIMKIFNNVCRDDVVGYVLDEINKLCKGAYNYKKFIITKSIKSCEASQGPFRNKDDVKCGVSYFKNEKGQLKGKLGDYTVPLLSEETKERDRQFKLKKCTNAKEYYTRCLPAAVQLGEKMKRRGKRVDPGTRLGYLVTTQGGLNGKQYEKIEDEEYFSQYRYILRVDYLYYLKLMSNPFDDVLNILYLNKEISENQKKFKKDFVLNQHKYRSKTRFKMHEELKKLFQPKIKLN